jgi:3'5'-cyclic nucleotide phosphodiesterase
MHAASLIRILLQPSHNFLSHLPSDVFQRIRQYMKHAILCTDPASHNEHMANWMIYASEWKQHAQHARAGQPGLRGLRSEAFLPMIGMLLKCADIMHMSQHFEQHRRWVEALTEEFYQQGDRETALGMPALPFMQRDRANCLPSSQVWDSGQVSAACEGVDSSVLVET